VESNVQRAFRQAAEKDRLAACAPREDALDFLHLLTKCRPPCSVAIMRSVLGIFLCCRLLVIATQGATLAGQSVRGGATVEIRFPVAKSFQDIAAQKAVIRDPT